MQQYIHEGIFNPINPLHRCIIEPSIMRVIVVIYYVPSHARSCLAYCYVNLVERELEEFMTEWNGHKIRTISPDVLLGYPMTFLISQK